VGYTNAGKSTLLNALVGEEAAGVEDMLFATLDPTTRRVRLHEGQTVIVSDTVGFIHKLPHQLVEAFQATLEEVVRADVLLEVVDMSDRTLPTPAYCSDGVGRVWERSQARLSFSTRSIL
jgi:GTP-binding protein HflX